MMPTLMRAYGSLLSQLGTQPEPSSPSQYQQPTKRICDTIHYEFIQGKIVIPVVVNGVKVKYIVDTGGQTGTDWEHVKAMGGVAT